MTMDNEYKKICFSIKRRRESNGTFDITYGNSYQDFLDKIANRHKKVRKENNWKDEDEETEKATYRFYRIDRSGYKMVLENIPLKELITQVLMSVEFNEEIPLEFKAIMDYSLTVCPCFIEVLTLDYFTIGLDRFYGQFLLNRYDMFWEQLPR